MANHSKLLFLSDTFQWELSTYVTTSGEDEAGSYVETEATNFYPGGGGQEPDKGSITDKSGHVLPITDAALINGQVRHYYEKGESALNPGDEVIIYIDKSYRLQNARLHTGGHLLSSVVYEKLKLPLVPVKGFHYQQGAYIEFEPLEESPVIDENAISEAVRSDIQEKLPVITRIVTGDSILFKQAFKPAGFVVPEDKPLRLVKIGDYQAIPCGGTHLHHTGEINFLNIKHIKHKKGKIRISYEAG